MAKRTRTPTRRVVSGDRNKILQEHERQIESCIESERSSYESIDKMKLSLAIGLFGMLSLFVATISSVLLLLAKIAVLISALLVVSTYLSFKAAIFYSQRALVESRKHVCSSNEELNLTKWQTWLANHIDHLNNISEGILLVLIVFVVVCAFLIPNQKTQSTNKEVSMSDSRKENKPLPPQPKTPKSSPSIGPGIERKEGVKPPPPPPPPPKKDTGKK